VTVAPAPRPDDAGLAEAAAELAGAYVHIPFCRRRCPYCDFAVEAPTADGDERIEVYVAALVAEIAMAEPFGRLDAVNLGGGTPSTLTARQLAQILEALADRNGINAAAEISIEANPEDWSPTLGSQLRACGFTRVSFGVQSFDPVVLSTLGRLHTPEQADAAVIEARAAGFSTNLDLIYGSPVETAASWRASVERALALEPNHVSAYALTVEPGTELARSVLAGAPAPDADIQADRYEYLAAVAEAAGLVRYEVSNWAEPGHHCRYNLATWAQGEYVGFGLGAHDHIAGVRARNHRRLDRYLEAVMRGDRPRLGAEEQQGFAGDQERVMLGLRRVAGVVAGDSGSCLLESEAGRRLVAAGLLAADGGRLRVTDPLRTDTVVRAVLSLSPGEC